MNFKYQTKGSTEWKECRVVFDPPLAGYEEVKPRLMNMKGEAEEELGMVRPTSILCLTFVSNSFIRSQVRAPQVTSFRWSSKYITTAVAVTFLIYTTLAPISASSEYGPLFAPGNIILSYLPSWSLKFSWGMVVGFHSLEALYVLYLCKKHSTGLLVGVRVVFSSREQVCCSLKVVSCRHNMCLRGYYWAGQPSP